MTFGANSQADCSGIRAPSRLYVNRSFAIGVLEVIMRYCKQFNIYIYLSIYLSIHQPFYWTISTYFTSLLKALTCCWSGETQKNCTPHPSPASTNICGNAAGRLSRELRKRLFWMAPFAHSKKRHTLTWHPRRLSAFRSSVRHHVEGKDHHGDTCKNVQLQQPRHYDKSLARRRTYSNQIM